MRSGNVWVDPEGYLRIEGRRCLDLAREFGTPLYVLSENQIRENYRDLCSAFEVQYPNFEIYYAIKANPNLSVLRILLDEGAGAECVSLGEIETALAAGYTPQKMVLNGANKSHSEISQAIDLGMSLNVDGMEELIEVIHLAKQLGKSAKIRMRLSIAYLLSKDMLSASSPVVSEFYLNKWGIGAEQLERVCELALSESSIEMSGIHFHLGLTRLHSQSYPTAIERAITAWAMLRDKYGWQAKELDIGGGFRYGSNPEGGMSEQITPAVCDYAQAISMAITDAVERYALHTPALLMEVGRHLVGNAGVLLTRVGVVKSETAAGIPMVNVDASFGHLMMGALLPALYPVLPVVSANSANLTTVNITGQTCSPDVLGYRRSLPPVRSGEVLAFLETGAYAEAMASQYNSIPRPATVLVNRDEANVVSRRETVHDVLARQSMPKHLLGAEPRGLHK